MNAKTSRLAMLLSVGLGLGTLCGLLCPQPLAAEDRDQSNDRHGDHDVTLDAHLQYGIWTGDGDVNAFGFGLGARGGITIGPGVYLGADFDYYFGEHQDAGVSGLGGGSAHLNTYSFLAEIGYDIDVSRADVLRPKVGIGVGWAHGSACVSVAGIAGGCTSRSESGVSFEPGLQYLHFFDNIYLSLDAHYQVISIDGSDPQAFVLAAGVGAAL